MTLTTINIERGRLVTQESYTMNMYPTSVQDINNVYYIPFFLQGISAPTFTINNLSGTAGTSTITALAPSIGTAGAFDSGVKVGDIITGTSTGTLNTLSTSTISCYTSYGLNYVVYPHTYTSSNLPMQSGDVISGTGIPANTQVNTIDYANRRIYLTNSCTVDGIATLTITPAIRIIAVRPSTAISNANQIDINTTIATTITFGTLTVLPGALDGLFGCVSVTPIGSATSGKATFSVSAATLDGTQALGSASGFNGVDITALSYGVLGNFSFNVDSFLLKARVPSPS
jgi:hypothetical protein